MILLWKPRWYELDQTIVVGETDFYYMEIFVHQNATLSLCRTFIIMEQNVNCRGELECILKSWASYSFSRPCV